MISIRALDPPASAKALVELWNRSLAETFPLDEALYLQQLRMERDELLLLGAFAEDSRELGQARGGSRSLLGACLVKRCRRPEPDGSVPALGHLSFLLVDGPARRRGLGAALLAAAEDWLRERGAERLSLGADRYHFFPGLPLDGSPSSEALAAFLRAKGFELGGIEEDLIAELDELDLEALAGRARIAPGFRFALYRPEHRAALEAFLAASFPGRWRDEILEALPAGLRGEDLALLIEEATGSVVGFARIYEPSSPILGPSVYWRGLMGPSPGGLGPIGIDERRRGLGLGLGLLHACLVELKARGVRAMAIDWTDLAPFYAKLGFRVWKRYRLASKDLLAGGARAAKAGG